MEPAVEGLRSVAGIGEEGEVVVYLHTYSKHSRYLGNSLYFYLQPRGKESTRLQRCLVKRG